MEKQKDLVKAWAKIKLNSSYRFPTVSILSIEYDKNEAHKITEEGKKNLMLAQEVLKNSMV